MKQNKNRSKRSHPVHAPTGKKLGFLGFILSFAALGGILLFFQSQAAIVYQTDPIHKAQCILNSPSKTVVKPGERFTARVQIKNTGTSVFAGSVGMALAELRDGAAIWNASGTDLSNNVGPGGTATFNLSVRAPSTPGTYTFDWAMGIVFRGYIRSGCTGKTIRVTNPPSVNLKVNGKSSNISLQRGQSLSLNWSASNSPTSCTASGTWGGSKAASGTENRSGDTRASGTKSYTLSCSNQVGTSTQTRVVTVTNPPSSGGGGSSTPVPRPSGGSGGSTSRPSGNTSTPSAPAPIAPPAPTNFSALLSEDSAVQLSWELPEYFGALSGYELERSTDNEKWERVGPESLTDQAYVDTTTDFQTTYYYRVRTLEASGLKSDYATTETTTGEFVSNLEAEGTTLTSDDQSVTVFIPKDAIEEEASCNLYNNNDVLPPTEDKHVTLTGPYEILCKNKDGNLIESFKVPVEVSVTENTSYKGIRYFSYEEDWQEVTPERADNIAKFTLQDQTIFTAIGQEKSTPLWIKILIGLFIIVGLVLGVLLLLNIINRIKQRNQYETQNEDYYRKEHGY